MLSRAFEWYRTVNVQPTSATLDKRKAAVADIIEEIDRAGERELALGCAAGVVAGFEQTFSKGSPVVTSLVSAIRTHESAFPEDLSENALELRACAALALGEILVRNNENGLPVDALLIASALRAGLCSRQPENGSHLQQMIRELDIAAGEALASGALFRRRPVDALGDTLELSQPADLAAAWKVLIPALAEAAKSVAEQSAIDREELNVLWWMFGGASNTTGQQISEMGAGAAILCCGTELGNQCLLPPTVGIEPMVRRAYESGRKTSRKTQRNIEELAAEWDDRLARVLVPTGSPSDRAKRYPTLFPVSWLCDRLSAGGSAPWAAEFEHATQLPLRNARSTANWAVQVLRERIAHRVLDELAEV